MCFLQNIHNLFTHAFVVFYIYFIPFVFLDHHTHFMEITKTIYPSCTNRDTACFA